ncbi:hypothetical protein ACWF9B_03190 [Streptomyces sp. NPDC055089]
MPQTSPAGISSPGPWLRGSEDGRLVNGRERRLLVDTLGSAIVKRIDDMCGFVVLLQRWVVGRLFAHLMRSRRLVRCVERRSTARRRSLPQTKRDGRRGLVPQRPAQRWPSRKFRISVMVMGPVPCATASPSFSRT